MSLFQRGSYQLHSGDVSDFKIDCDHLSLDDIDCAAYLIAQRVQPFCAVIGIPQGGLRIADALRRYVTPSAWPTLLVDDVLTTGRSMIEVRDNLGLPYPCIGAVIFARQRPPAWIKALFQLAV